MADADSTPTGRICTKCGEFRPWSEYTKATRGFMGRNQSCKSCSRKYYAENKARILASSKTRYEANRESIKAYSRSRYRQKKPELLEQCKAYRRTERAKALKKKFLSSPERKMDNAIRVGIRKALRGQKKSGPTWGFLEYQLADLMSHLERQFIGGMSWGNYGKWHIDHIVPVAEIIGTGPAEECIKRAWRLSNLRPIWAKDNLSKSSKRVFLI